MDTTATTLLPKLLEISLTVTILAALLMVAFWAIYKLWQSGVTKDKDHAAELATLNTLRLQEQKEAGQRSKESSDHLRTMVEMQTRLLTHIEQRGIADEKTHGLVVEIASKLDIDLKSFI